MSASPSPEKTRIPPSLLVWLLVACVLFVIAPAPPPPPDPTPEELAAQQRGAEFVVRDVKRWQAEHGDLWLPWDEADGHLAIVIDDVGRELHVFELLLSLRFRLTFAVLPGSVYAAGAQLRLRGDRRRYREILVHLPMEPLRSEQMHAGDDARETFLRHGDSPEVLQRKVELALERVPAAVGVNNHMGSRLTADAAAMAAIMPTLAERNLMFLDSRTTEHTQAEAAARAQGLVTGARDVFLDNVVEEAAIDSALDRATAMARERPVVVIGHPSVELFAVLRRRLPELHAQGIGVYPLSWILQRMPPHT
jgi:hypothetical protein